MQLVGSNPDDKQQLLQFVLVPQLQKLLISTMQLLIRIGLPQQPLQQNLQILIVVRQPQHSQNLEFSLV